MQKNYFLVSGKINNITNIIKVNNLQWHIFVKNEQLINLKPYDFFIRNEKNLTSKELEKFPVKKIKLSNQLEKKYIEINLNSNNVEEENTAFFNKIFQEHNTFLKNINYLDALSVYSIIDQAFLAIKNDHKKYLSELENIFALIKQKQNIENAILEEIKKVLPLLQNFQNWYNGNSRRENTEIKMIFSLILKKILEENK